MSHSQHAVEASNAPGHAYPIVSLEVDLSGPHATTNLVRATVTWEQNCTTIGWGRDESLAQARHKALGEAVERRAYQQPVPMKSSRYVDLPNPVSPESIIRYSSTQYASDGFPFKPFDPDKQYWWVEGRSVDGNTRVEILADCVLNPRTFDADYRDRLYTHATSSGCASGLTREAAIVRGAAELVERDAFMRHWFKQSSGSAVAIDSVPDQIRKRISALNKSGHEVAIRCLEDGPYPAWMVWAQHERLHFTVIGTSSGLDAEIALKRALDELETGVLQNLSGVYGGIDMQASAVAKPHDHGALFATREYFRQADDFLRNTDASTTWSEAKEKFAGATSSFFQHLKAKRLDIYWIDLSLKQASCVVDGAPMYTVRVVIPGLIPITFGYERLPLGMVDRPNSGSYLVHPFA